MTGSSIEGETWEGVVDQRKIPKKMSDKGEFW